MEIHSFLLIEHVEQMYSGCFFVLRFFNPQHAKIICVKNYLISYPIVCMFFISNLNFKKIILDLDIYQFLKFLVKVRAVLIVIRNGKVENYTQFLKWWTRWEKP